MSVRLAIEGGRLRLFAGDDCLPVLVEATGILRSSSNLTPVNAIYGTTDFDPLGIAAPCWQEDGGHSDGGLESAATGLLARNPEARFFVRLNSCSPPWWDSAHEEELVVWEDGSTSRPIRGAVKTRFPSLHSEVWCAAQFAGLDRFVRRWEAGPFGAATLGYVIGCGALGGWGRVGAIEGYLGDYNPQALAAFNAWLAKDGSLEPVTALPTAFERGRVSPVGIRDPRDSAIVLAFERFLAETVTRRLEGLADCVKHCCDGRKLVGVPHGDILNMSSFQDGIPLSGAMDVKGLLDCQSVDFVICNRTIPQARSSQGIVPAGPLAGAARRGKAVFLSCADPGLESWPPPATAAAVVEACLGYASNQGMGLWIDETCAMPTQLVEPSRPSSSVDGPRVGFVIDDRSVYFLKRERTQLRELLAEQALHLSRFAPATRVILRSDLADEEPCDLLVFPDLVHCDARGRAELHAILSRWRATAIWLAACGFVDEGVAFENGARLTGVRLEKPVQAHLARLQLVDELGSEGYGHDLVAHTAVVADPSAIVLGRYRDSGLPGIAGRSMDGWISIVSAVPGLTPAVLQALATAGRAQILSESGLER